MPINGVTRTFAVAETAPPRFDRTADRKSRHSALVRVKAFSLNYRDLSLIAGEPLDAPLCIGSEFCGVVEAVGPSVERLSVGDRVMANMSWPHSGDPSVMGGVPTNRASAELQVLHECKLVKLPDNMSVEEGAAFVLGSQTAFSMVRKLALRASERVLVTAARSNTALCVLARLRALGAEVYAATTSAGHQELLRQVGAHHVIPHAAGDAAPLVEVVRAAGSFPCAADPFADVYLPVVLPCLEYGGRYTFCGLSRDNDSAGGSHRWVDLLGAMMVKNVSLHGNCLGHTSDLDEALDAYKTGTYSVRLDSVITATDVGAFIHRSYCEPGRFGKVVCYYP